MKKQIITTPEAPKAIGTYSQAVKMGNIVWCSGQIPLDPVSMELVGDASDEGVRQQIHQVFKNLVAIAKGSGATLDDVVKVNLYLTDLSHFPKVNEIMPMYFKEPFPARSTLGVASLPRGAAFEAEIVIVLPD